MLGNKKKKKKKINVIQHISTLNSYHRWKDCAHSKVIRDFWTVFTHKQSNYLMTPGTSKLPVYRSLYVLSWSVPTLRTYYQLLLTDYMFLLMFYVSFCTCYIWSFNKAIPYHTIPYHFFSNPIACARRLLKANRSCGNK